MFTAFVKKWFKVLVVTSVGLYDTFLCWFSFVRSTIWKVKLISAPIMVWRNSSSMTVMFQQLLNSIPTCKTVTPLCSSSALISILMFGFFKHQTIVRGLSELQWASERTTIFYSRPMQSVTAYWRNLKHSYFLISISNSIISSTCFFEFNSIFIKAHRSGFRRKGEW